MQNWVYHKVLVTKFNGETGDNALHEFVEKYGTPGKNDEEGTLFDFNKVIPMPSELRITSGSSVDKVRNFLEEQDEFFEKIIESTLDQSVVEYLSKEINLTLDMEDIKEGIQSCKNKRKHGYTDWYEWSIAKWGCKWNAARTGIVKGQLLLETPWSTPTLTWEKLAELEPTLEMEIKYADEDKGSNCGIITVEEGAVNWDFIGGTDGAEEFAEEVYS